MKSYNLLERKLAQTLDSFPQLKQTAKTAYQYLNYWYYGDRYQLVLHPDVTLLTPSQWSNITSTEAELFFGYYDKSPWSPNMSQLVYHRQQQDSLEIVVYKSLSKISRDNCDYTNLEFPTG